MKIYKAHLEKHRTCTDTGRTTHQDMTDRYFDSLEKAQRYIKDFDVTCCVANKDLYNVSYDGAGPMRRVSELKNGYGIYVQVILTISEIEVE